MSCNPNPCLDNFPNFPFFTGWQDWNRPKSSSCPPSPTPPWSRIKQSNLNQVITQNDTVSLTMDPTFLDRVLANPPAPVTANIPDGNIVGQYKQIFIAGNKIPTTETFTITGNFAGGFTKLVFNSVGFSALLMWDGSSWQLVSGSAELQP